MVVVSLDPAVSSNNTGGLAIPSPDLLLQISSHRLLGLSLYGRRPPFATHTISSLFTKIVLSSRSITHIHSTRQPICLDTLALVALCIERNIQHPYRHFTL